MDTLGPTPSRPDRQGPVVVLGAGLMGSQIGVEYAIHGYHVLFLTAHRAKGEMRVDATLERAQTLDVASPEICAAAFRGIRFVDAVAELPTDAALVMECLPEDFDLKCSVVREVAARIPASPLASNTSSLSITALGIAVGAPTRTIGLHYWNPPLLMPLVELTPGDATEPGVVTAARRLVEDTGKIVVVVRRDVPGFIWNRLQMAILREALWLVDEGVATIDDIDTVTRLGLARRWRHTGLFSSIYLGGPETWERVAANLFPLLSDADHATGLATLVRDAGASWADSSDRRDRALASDRAGARPQASGSIRRADR